MCQPDFLQQKTLLEEVGENLGMKIINFPKYHCELNPIEGFWGQTKKYSRINCDYSWNGLEACIPKALANVSLLTIQKIFHMCKNLILGNNI